MSLCNRRHINHKYTSQSIKLCVVHKCIVYLICPPEGTGEEPYPTPKTDVQASRTGLNAMLLACIIMNQGSVRQLINWSSTLCYPTSLGLYITTNYLICITVMSKSAKTEQMFTLQDVYPTSSSVPLPRVTQMVQNKDDSSKGTYPIFGSSDSWITSW